MDIMRPLRVRIDVTEGTATPAQPDPQTIHLNAAQTQQPQKKLLPRPARSPHLPQEAAVSGASLLDTQDSHKPPTSASAPGQVASRGRERDSS